MADLNVKSTTDEQAVFVSVPDGAIFGPLVVTVVSGSGTFLQDASKPLEVTFVSEEVEGVTVYAVKGKVAENGPKFVEESVEYSYGPGVVEATKLNLTFVRLEPKP